MPTRDNFELTVRLNFTRFDSENMTALGHALGFIWRGLMQPEQQQFLIENGNTQVGGVESSDLVIHVELTNAPIELPDVRTDTQGLGQVIPFADPKKDS